LNAVEIHFLFRSFLVTLCRVFLTRAEKPKNSIKTFPFRLSWSALGIPRAQFKGTRKWMRLDPIDVQQPSNLRQGLPRPSSRPSRPSKDVRGGLSSRGKATPRIFKGSQGHRQHGASSFMELQEESEFHYFTFFGNSVFLHFLVNGSPILGLDFPSSFSFWCSEIHEGAWFAYQYHLQYFLGRFAATLRSSALILIFRLSSFRSFSIPVVLNYWDRYLEMCIWFRNEYVGVLRMIWTSEVLQSISERVLRTGTLLQFRKCNRRIYWELRYVDALKPLPPD
jgi:hypothetical protein